MRPLSSIRRGRAARGEEAGERRGPSGRRGGERSGLGSLNRGTTGAVRGKEGGSERNSKGAVQVAGRSRGTDGAAGLGLTGCPGPRSAPSLGRSLWAACGRSLLWVGPGCRCPRGRIASAAFLGVCGGR